MGRRLLAVTLVVGAVCAGVAGCRPKVVGLGFDQSEIVLAHNGEHRPHVTASLSTSQTRDVTGAAAGTSYSSTDEDVVRVSEDGTIHASATAITCDSATIRATHGGHTADLVVTIKNTLAATVAPDPTGLPTVTNYNLIDAVVNKQRNLPATYVPEGLVVPDVRFSFSGEADKKYLRPEAAEALGELFAAAEAEGFRLAAVSGYRSYATQKSIFDRNVQLHGREAASRFSAYPGQSEHQTGLAMDVSSGSVGFRLVEEFGETAEGKWLAAHAAEYGFVIRYPQGSEPVTGYSYEPWHLRYVGPKIAAEVAALAVTLEEYLAGPASP